MNPLTTIIVLISLNYVSSFSIKSYKKQALLDDTNLKSDECPYGLKSQVPGDPNCYIFHEYPRKFYQAQESCKLFGSDLVTVPNNDINQFISQIASSKFNPDGELTFWVGGQNLVDQNKWIWLDGSIISSYTNWDKGQPNNYTEQRCLGVKIQNGKWFSSQCYTTKPYVCVYHKVDIRPTHPSIRTTTQPEKTTKKSFTTTVPNPCPDNSWIYLPKNNKCFLVKYATNYYYDEQLCEHYGGHLASVHSFEENSFITDIGKLYNETATQMLIGLHLKHSNKTVSFNWSDNTPVDYLFWEKVDSNDNSGLCTAINLDIKSDYGQWLVTQCDDNNNHLSICQLIIH